MKKITLAVTILVTLILTSTAFAAWYEGGNLHRATVSEWKRATWANKIATAGDIVTSCCPNIVREVKRSGSMDTLYQHALQLVTCMDTSVRGDVNGSMRVSRLAALCISTMGMR